METFHRSLFPNWWRSPLPELKTEVEIVVDWLEREVEPYKIEMMPTLKVLSGWRNREVYYYIKDGKDWTAGIRL